MIRVKKLPEVFGRERLNHPSEARGLSALRFASIRIGEKSANGYRAYEFGVFVRILP
jgi:hypothetical protein